MNAAEIRELLKKKHKYGAIKYAGFDSKLEAAVYQILKFREKAKEITDIKCKQTVHLTRADISWCIDFSFIDLKSGELMYCEAKGVQDKRYMIVKKLYKFYGPAALEIWKGTWQSPYLEETIIPNWLKNRTTKEIV